MVLIAGKGIFRHLQRCHLQRSRNHLFSTNTSPIDRSRYVKLVIACEVIIGIVLAIEVGTCLSAYSMIKYPEEFDKGMDADLNYARDSIDSVTGIVGIGKTSDEGVKYWKGFIMGYYDPFIEAYKYFGFVEKKNEVSLIDKFKKTKVSDSDQI